mgnify:CR=1 FL=1
MAEYIEREAMKRALRNAHLHLDETGIVIEIDDIPTADVQPVKHGKWVQIKLLQDGYKAKECSACKATFWDLYPWNYCANCGAKMVGEDDV